MTAVFSDAVRRGFIYRDEVENDRGIDWCDETRFYVPRWSWEWPRYLVMRWDAVLYTAMKLRMTAVSTDATRRGFMYRGEVENDRGI